MEIVNTFYNLFHFMKATKISDYEPSQGTVLVYMEKHQKWLTSEDIAEVFKIDRERAARFLRKLWKFDFIERRKKENSVELEYKINR